MSIVKTYVGESFDLVVDYDPANFDPTGATATLKVFSGSSTILSKSASPVLADGKWTITFAVAKGDTDAATPGDYPWHVRLETAQHFKVVATGSIKITKTPARS